MPKPREHELKCWPQSFEAIVEGRKTHEFRKDDRGFRVGDTLQLREYDPVIPRLASSDVPHYTGRRVACQITYISRGPEHGIPEGHVIMSIFLVIGVWHDSPATNAGEYHG